MTGSVIHTAHKGPIYALAHDPVTGSIYSASGDGFVLRWHITDPDVVVQVAQVPAPIYAMATSGDGDLLFLGTSGGELFVLSPRQGAAVHRFAAHKLGIFSILQLDEERFVCAGGDGTLSVWNISSAGSDQGRLTLQRRIPLSDGKLRGLSLSEEGRLLLVACGDGMIRVLETALFNEVTHWSAHPEGTNVVVQHPTKRVLVSGGKDGHLRAWDMDHNHAPLLSIPAHRGTIYAIIFDPDDRWLMSASRDKTIKVWDTTSFEPLERSSASQGGHSHSVNALLWNQGQLYSGGDDRRLIEWHP